MMNFEPNRWQLRGPGGSGDEQGSNPAGKASVFFRRSCNCSILCFRDSDRMASTRPSSTDFSPKKLK